MKRIKAKTKEEKSVRQLNLPKGADGKRPGIPLLGAARVESVELAQVRSASVSMANRRGAPSSFHNPMVALGQAINASMSLDKVLATVPGDVRTAKDLSTEERAKLEAQHGKIVERDPYADGVKLPFIRVTQVREKAKRYLLPSGWETWLPNSAILHEEPNVLFVQPWVRRKRVFSYPPKPKATSSDALTKDQAKARLLALRTKPTTKPNE